MKALLGAVLLFAGVAWGATLYSGSNPPPSTSERAVESSASSVLSASLSASSTALAAEPQKKEETVYITDTGEKYHRAGCRHLRRSRHPVKLSEAKRQGYEACKVCRPAR